MYLFRPSRTATIVIFLVSTKLLAFAYLFNLEFIEPYGKLHLDEWWLIFHRWDSAFYDRIASLGYIDLRHWAFLPAFPAMIKVIYFFIGHSGSSTALAGLLLGIAWVPIYYKLASNYIGDKAATYSTLLFAFFPTVYLFTSVGYSEGLWLTSTLVGWYFYTKHKHHLSSIMLTLSTLTRLPGFILPTIIFIQQLKQRKMKQSLLYLFPLAVLAVWFAYGFIQTGEPIAPIAAQQKTAWNPNLNFLEFFLAPLAAGRPPASWNEHSAFIILIVALFSYLHIRVFSVDNVLGIYSICLLAMYLSTGYFLSLTRFLPFTFPIWMGLKVEEKKIIWPYIIFNYILALLLWSEFLNDRWVG